MAKASMKINGDYHVVKFKKKPQILSLEESKKRVNLYADKSNVYHIFRCIINGTFLDQNGVIMEHNIKLKRSF